VNVAALAHLAQPFAVILALVSGGVPLRQLRAQRRCEAAFALLQSIPSPRMSHRKLIIEIDKAFQKA
jgi:hypothetical protein